MIIAAITLAIIDYCQPFTPLRRLLILRIFAITLTLLLAIGFHFAMLITPHYYCHYFRHTPFLRYFAAPYHFAAAAFARFRRFAASFFSTLPFC
jgi:hypothetical protein